MSRKIDEIYANVLPDMAKHGIKDTTENRLAYLTGLRDGWVEDGPKPGTDKQWWLLALNVELMRLEIVRRREQAVSS